MISINEETNTTVVADSVEGTTEVAEQTQETAPAPAENAEPVTQEAEGESFFDPTSIPEELKPAYKQMQAAFTKKTQEIAEAKKEAEAIRQKAEAYDKYQQHIPIVEEMLANRQQPVQSPELQALEQQYKEAGYSDEAIEMMKMGIGFALNHVNQSQAKQQEFQRLDSQIAEAGKVDPRLNDQNLVYDLGDGEKQTYGEIVEELVSADPQWRKDPVGATRKAIKKVDALIGRAKTEGKEELSNLTKTKAAKFPSTQASPQGASAAGGSTTIRDAWKEAQAETGIRLKS